MATFFRLIGSAGCAVANDDARQNEGGARRVGAYIVLCGSFVQRSGGRQHLVAVPLGKRSSRRNRRIGQRTGSEPIQFGITLSKRRSLVEATHHLVDDMIVRRRDAAGR